MWTATQPTAVQLRRHLLGVFKFAVATRVIDRNPASAEYLSVLLPEKMHRPKRRREISFEDVPRFLERLRGIRREGRYPVER
jgi:hypothetical protein